MCPHVYLEGSIHGRFLVRHMLPDHPGNSVDHSDGMVDGFWEETIVANGFFKDFYDSTIVVNYFVKF